MTTKSVKDYYAILGVSPKATLEEIRLAYRKQARVFHPDLSSEPNAEERFREINEAYGVLANSEKRRAYDFFVAEATQEAAPSAEEASPTVTSTTPPTASSAPAEEIDREEARPIATPPPTQPTSSQASQRRIYPPTWAILLIILGTCIILGVLAGVVLSLQRNRPTGGAESVAVSKLTTFVSPPVVPPDLTVIQENDTPLPTIGPVVLEVPGASWPVVAVVPEQGRWPLPEQQQDIGLWMHGTIINYVIGLPYSASIESQLSSLTSGDRITLTLENGARLAFGSPQVRRVDLGDAEPLMQDKPGLTLMILGSDRPSRLIVKARYLPEDTRPPSQQESDGLVVEVLNTYIVQDATPLEDNAWYFVVDYQVENPTAATVDPSFFDLTLEDGGGQRYTYNEAAAQLGTYGPLQNTIEPGTIAGASAGYVIPRSAATPLVWSFRADVTSSERARFVLGFEPPGPLPAQPDIQLYEAFLDERRGVIVISGTVYNDGGAPLTVAAESVEMTSGTGRSSLEAASPPLPWTVPEGSFQDFEVQFSVPEDSDTALLNILGFAFEIEGLTP